MKLLYTILFSLFSLGVVLSQSQGQVNYNELLDGLKKEIKNGQPRTLRDIISISDHPTVSSKAIRLLKNHTFFTKKEIDVLKAKKSDLLLFYYNNSEKIKYSETLNAFYITPVEKRDVSFELKQNNDNASEANAGKLRRLLTDLNSKLESKKFEKAQKIVNQITQTEKVEYDVFLNILRDSRILNAPPVNQQNIYQSLLSAIEFYPDIEIAEITLQMVEAGFLEDQFASSVLTNITNNTPELGDRFEVDTEYFQFLLDSLNTLDQIRAYGYDRLINSRMSFFLFPVDYYGKVLAHTSDQVWMKQNVINDLNDTHHPRAFFYIAADLYKIWKEQSNEPLDAHLEAINSMSNLKIGIKGKNGKITFNPLQDETSIKNYFLYWAANYDDYEWDENRQIFTNKLETIAKTQNYERLFRRLNSRNDTIALESFVQLTEGEYLEIKSLAKKYRQLLRNQNKSLPSLRHKYLEQLSILTEYCRKNKISYKIKTPLARKLKKLLAAEDPKDRFAIENEILNTIQLNEITALEYWACLKEGNKKLSFSVGRILDWAYSKYWDKILADKDYLRLYLKKSYLFEHIGVSGICNSYLNKFDPSNEQEQLLLSEIGKIESDEDILNQISLIVSSDIEEDYTTYNIDDFLDDPLVFTRRDIKVLPSPSKEDIRKIVDYIKSEQEADVIKKLFAYMWQHPDIEYIPFLFELIDDQRIVTRKDNLTVSVADNIIPIVENVYNHSFEKNTHELFATDQWRILWKKDGKEFKIWEQKFFEQKLDSLQYFDKIKIQTLNELTESNFFSEKYKSVILSNLRKVKPKRSILRLSIDPKLSLTEDLKYFETFFFSYKELDDVPKLFDITEENIGLMLNFIEKKSASFEVSEKGSLYNKLLRAPWLSRYISQGKLNEKSTTIILEALDTYLNESEFLSEYEEQATQLNIAQLQFMGKSIEEKIDATIALDTDNPSKAKILKSIIATISYEEIGIIVSRFDQMYDILNEKTYSFLSEDFGIPVFSFKSMKEQEQFIRNHKKLPESQFYYTYLKQFGLNFQTKKGELHLQKAYDILRFDIVSPFVGETGGKRDLYIYGIIKLLELKYDTRLGFHEKLNESQTFYSFSSTKRAQAWIKYLEENKLVSPNDSMAPPFNSIKDQN